MAKKPEQGNGGKSKMTVVMFHTEGSDATLLEGFRTISLAMTSLLKPAQLSPPRKGLSAPLESDAVDLADENNETDGVDTAVESGQESVRPTKQRSYRSPEILTDLDLTAGKISLKAFLEEKKVGENDSKRTLAAAVWLKQNRGIVDIGADHLFTCYRHMGWTTAKDVMASVRGLKKLSCFSKGKEPGTYAVNHIGENRVLEMATS